MKFSFFSGFFRFLGIFLVFFSLNTSFAQSTSVEITPEVLSTRQDIVFTVSHENKAGTAEPVPKITYKKENADRVYDLPVLGGAGVYSGKITAPGRYSLFINVNGVEIKKIVDVGATFSLQEGVEYLHAGVQEGQDFLNPDGTVNQVLTSNGKNTTPKHLVGVNDRLKGDAGDITQILQRIMLAVVNVIGIVAVFMLIWHARGMVFAFGGDGVTESKKGIQWVILGLILISLAFIVVRTIVQLFFLVEEESQIFEETEILELCPDDLRQNVLTVSENADGLSAELLAGKTTLAEIQQRFTLLENMAKPYENLPSLQEKTNNTYGTLNNAVVQAKNLLLESQKAMNEAENGYKNGIRKSTTAKHACGLGASAAEVQNKLQEAQSVVSLAKSSVAGLSVLDGNRNQVRQLSQNILNGGAFEFCKLDSNCNAVSNDDYDGDGVPNGADGDAFDPMIQ